MSKTDLKGMFEGMRDEPTSTRSPFFRPDEWEEAIAAHLAEAAA